VENRAPERFLLKMPQNLHSYDKQICVSEGFGNQASLCQPIEEEEEYELVNTMIDELNSKCGLELSHEFSLYRPRLTSKPEREDVPDDVIEKVIMMGGSHSSRLTDELHETCLDITDISVHGWKLTDESVEEKVRELKEIVATCDEKRTTVVHQLFDNVSFMAKKPDGTRSLPQKGRDGRYHMEGKLDIIGRDEIKKMVSTSIPLLRAGGQCRKVILTPAGRYRYTPCCTTVGHVSNLRDRNYGQWMEEMRNIKRTTVIEMGQLLTPSAGQSSYLHEEEIWGEDPVHLTTKGYGMVAEEKESQGPSKKPRYDAAESRPAWVKGSVAEAVRRGGCGGQPRPPFKHPWRGSNQVRGGRGGANPRKGSGGDSRHNYSYGSRSRQPRGRGGYRGRGYGAPRGPHRGRGRPW
jgi:hypothetical protein